MNPNEILFSLLGSEELVNKWWQSPNKAFNGDTPQETLDKDRESVIQYILGQLNGDYS